MPTSPSQRNDLHRNLATDQHRRRNAELDFYEKSNLSQGQLTIWRGQSLAPQSPHHNMAFRFTIDGRIDTDRFVQAFQRMLEQTDALRTTFSLVDGVPRQSIVAAPDFELEVVDFSHLPCPDDAISQWEHDRGLRMFDLGSRLFDSALFRCADDRFAWWLNMHHLVTDAASTLLLYRRMEQAYRQVTAGEQVCLGQPPSSVEYAQFERDSRHTKRYEKSQKYWREKIQASQPLSFYGQRNSGVCTAAQRVVCELDKDRTDALRKLAMSDGTRAITSDLSLFNVIATLVFAYLHRVSERKDIRICTPLHNRQTKEFRETIGTFIESFPLAVAVDRDTTFRSLLKQVAAEQNSLLLHAAPGVSGESDAHQLDVFLNYMGLGIPDFLGFPTTTQWSYTGHIDPGHSMRVQVTDLSQTGAFEIAFDLSHDVFDEVLSSRVREHFIKLVDAFIGDLDQPIQLVDLLTEGEKQRCLPSPDLKQLGASSPTTVIDLFEEQLAKSPGSIAVVSGSQQLTYQELDERANVVAHRLLSQGLEPRSLIGIYLPRSTDAIVAMLGTLKAGMAYLPLDRSDPQERISLAIETSQTQIVLTDPSKSDGLPADIERIEMGQLDWDSRPGAPANARPVASQLSYVICTSGSTGKPKGVEVSHQSLGHYIRWAGAFYCGDQQLAFPLFTNLAFDLTVTSVFVPLTTGGRIVVYPESSEQGDLSLLEVLDGDQVDIIKLTPSHMALIRDRDLRNSRVSQFIVGGESLHTELASSMLARFGGRLSIHNEYGPTEATVGCTVHTFNPEVDSATTVPIGAPIDNMRAYVLNESLAPVPQGVVGELHVAGLGLARGYRNRPDLTAASFLDNPFEPGDRLYRTGDLARFDPQGRLECLGRSDDQLKIRGVRMEIGEIENALTRHSLINASAVRAVDRPQAWPVINQHCVRCGLPENYPGIHFDTGGVCDSCVAYDTYKDRAQAYFKTMEDLQSLFAESQLTNQGEYDCLALLSGGKDSTYALGRLVDMGLRVFAYTLDNGYLSEQAKGNIQRVVKTLQVDHEFGSTPAMADIFVDSLKRHANVCHGCFKTVYTMSLKVAREKRIPIIVTGLSRGQLFETRLTEELFTSPEFDSERIDQTVLEARKAYHRVNDKVAQAFGDALFEDDRIFDEVRFVDFYRYCPVTLAEMRTYLDDRVPWIRPSDTGRSTNCLINDLGIFVHQRERGFHNYAKPYSWDVRMGHKTREEAIAELDDEIHLEDVERMLQEIGYDEYDATASSNDKQLVAYYTSPGEISMTELRAWMQEHVPAAMIPQRFLWLEQLPLTTHGKIDRQALPEPGTMRPIGHDRYVAPQTETERQLAMIWAAVLKTDQVGVLDNFFDLGGDSIAAIQVSAQANRSGLKLMPVHIFQGLTVRDTCLLLPADDDTAEAKPLVDDDKHLEKLAPRAIDQLANVLEQLDQGADQ